MTEDTKTAAQAADTLEKFVRELEDAAYERGRQSAGGGYRGALSDVRKLITDLEGKQTDTGTVKINPFNPSQGNH